MTYAIRRLPQEVSLSKVAPASQPAGVRRVWVWIVDQVCVVKEARRVLLIYFRVPTARLMTAVVHKAA